MNPRLRDIANGVQRALGRQPRDFSHDVGDAAAAGVWNGSRGVELQ